MKREVTDICESQNWLVPRSGDGDKELAATERWYLRKEAIEEVHPHAVVGKC